MVAVGTENNGSGRPSYTYRQLQKPGPRFYNVLSRYARRSVSKSACIDLSVGVLHACMQEKQSGVRAKPVRKVEKRWTEDTLPSQVCSTRK